MLSRLSLILLGLTVCIVRAATTPAPASISTAASSVSASLATAVPSPNPASLSSYPLCGQLCNNETIDLVDDFSPDLSYLCGPEFRSKTAACEKVSCSDSDYSQIQSLGQELCGTLYEDSPSISSAVSSAIASATSVAAAAVASKDVTDIRNYPACAQACIPPSLAAAGCSGLSDRACTCKNPTALKSLDACESSTCNASDLATISALGDLLCNPTFGIGNTTSGAPLSPGNGSNASNGSVTGGGSPPPPKAFTGDAANMLDREVGWLGLAVVGLLGWIAMG